MATAKLLAHCGTRKLTREELKALPVPSGTETHRPIPHHEVVGALVETLGFRPSMTSTSTPSFPSSLRERCGA